jgi:hypothetical protein
MGDPGKWRLRAAAGGSGTSVLERGVPKKRPVSDLSKIPKAKAAKSAKKGASRWKAKMRTAEAHEAKLQMRGFCGGGSH